MHFFNITSQKLAHSFTVIHWSRPSLRRVSEWCLNHGSGAFGVSALLTVRRRTKLAVHDRRLMCLSIRSFE